MRSSRFYLLILALLLPAGGAEASPRRRAPTPPVSEPVAVPAAPNQGAEFIRYGRTTSDAKDLALEDARRWVEEYVTGHYGTNGPVAVEDLSRHQMVRVEDHVQEVDLGRGERAQAVRVRVELTPSYLREVEDHAHQQRVEQRHLLTARVLGGLVVLLMVGVGYLRLEEATRGYYTTLLRLAALGLVALAGAGLLVLA